MVLDLKKQSLKIVLKLNWSWWHKPIFPALWRLRQKDHEFKASLAVILKLCFKKENSPCQVW
jgi:hypothetical protein